MPPTLMSSKAYLLARPHSSTLRIIALGEGCLRAPFARATIAHSHDETSLQVGRPVSSLSALAGDLPTDTKRPRPATGDRGEPLLRPPIPRLLTKSIEVPI